MKRNPTPNITVSGFFPSINAQEMSKTKCASGLYRYMLKKQYKKKTKVKGEHGRNNQDPQ